MNNAHEYLTGDISSIIKAEVNQGKILTWAGMYVDPKDPDPNDIRIDDIAHALSLICRYNGHTDVHYSVAQHCIVVVDRLKTMKAPFKAQLMGLLHDSEEAYLGDMVSPVKKKYPEFCADGDELRAFIYDQYIKDWDSFPLYSDLVKKADMDAYHMERLSFWAPYDVAERTIFEKFGRSVIKPIPPKQIELQFLDYFSRLTDDYI